MSKTEEKLVSLGYSLPLPPPPAGNYLAATRSGNVMWLAGVGSLRADGTRITGKLGKDLSTEQGYEAARWCALNLLTRIKVELGDLDQVARILKVVGMVNSAPDFFEQAQVVDGASDLFVDLFGDRGRHSRSAPGMAALPGNNAVIVQCVVEVTPGLGPGRSRKIGLSAGWGNPWTNLVPKAALLEAIRAHTRTQIGHKANLNDRSGVPDPRILTYTTPYGSTLVRGFFHAHLLATTRRHRNIICLGLARTAIWCHLQV